MLKKIDTSSRSQIIGKAVPSIRSQPWIPSFAFWKDGFNFLLEERVITTFSPSGQKSSSK